MMKTTRSGGFQTVEKVGRTCEINNYEKFFLPKSFLTINVSYSNLTEQAFKMGINIEFMPIFHTFPPNRLYRTKYAEQTCATSGG